MQALFALAFMPLAWAGPGEDLDLKALFKEGIPRSPFIAAVYGHANGLLERGLELDGADQNLLRLLYFLRELSGEERYSKAADEALRKFLAKPLEPAHLASRPWLLWERCFELNPEASRRLAMALTPGEESPRRAGFCIRAWAEAHARTGERAFLEAIEAALRRWESASGMDPASRLSLAVDCHGAAVKVPEPLRTRLELLASREDEAFLGAGEEVTTARAALPCVSRYENGGHLRFRDLILKAADAYLDALPGEGPAEGIGVWPMALGHAISLELAAFRATAKEKYFQRAYRLGEVALERSFKDTAGAGTLALALADLHLTTLHITAVRAPANTADR